jgi:hypothetical protein
VDLTSPAHVTTSNSAVYLDCDVVTGHSLSLVGTLTHSYGVLGLEYRWDDGDWQSVSSNGKLDVLLTADFAAETSHILTLRGRAAYDGNDASKKSNAYVLCAVLYVNVLPPPSVRLSFEIGNTVTERTVSADTETTLPLCDETNFAGWLGSDGSFLPSGAKITPQTDLTYSAIFLQWDYLDGAALSTAPDDVRLRFSAVLSNDTYRKLAALPSGACRLFATVTAKEDNEASEQVAVSILEIPVATGVRYRMDATTHTLTVGEYPTPFFAQFCAELSYTNGETAILYLPGTSDCRSAVEVAEQALADPSAPYAPDTVAFLKTFSEED